MEYEDRLTISTPEGVGLELALAGLGSRAIAGGIDLALKGLLVLALLIVLSLLDVAAVALFVPLAALVLFGYDVLFEVRGGGRTPGKRMTGLRVVREDGAPVDFVASAIRNAVRVVDGLTTSYVPTVLAVLATRRNQRPGDLAAGTIVVRERRPAAAERPPEAPLATEAVNWDLSAISRGELAGIRSFLQRRDDLTPDARAALARRLSEAVAAKVAGAPPDRDHERFLELVAARKAARG